MLAVPDARREEAVIRTSARARRDLERQGGRAGKRGGWRGRTPAVIRGDDAGEEDADFGEPPERPRGIFARDGKRPPAPSERSGSERRRESAARPLRDAGEAEFAHRLRRAKPEDNPAHRALADLQVGGRGHIGADGHGVAVFDRLDSEVGRLSMSAVAAGFELWRRRPPPIMVRRIPMVSNTVHIKYVSKTC